MGAQVDAVQSFVKIYPKMLSIPPRANLPPITLPGVAPKSVTAMNEVEKGMLMSIIWYKLNQLSQDMGGAASAMAELKAELGAVRAELSSRPTRQEAADDAAYPLVEELPGPSELSAKPAEVLPLLPLKSQAVEASSRDQWRPPGRMFEGAWQRAFRPKVRNLTSHSRDASASPSPNTSPSPHASLSSRVSPLTMRTSSSARGVQMPPRPTKTHEFKCPWDEADSPRWGRENVGILEGDLAETPNIHVPVQN